MTYPLSNAVFLMTVEQSNGSVSFPAAQWPVASRSAQAMGYSANLSWAVCEPGAVPSQQSYYQTTWGAIAPYQMDSNDGILRCNWHMPLATALIAAGISANLAHYAYSGKPLDWWIPGAPNSNWPTLLNWYKTQFLLCGSPTRTVVIFYQGESGVSTDGSYAGTWDQGAEEIMTAVRANFDPWARGVVVVLPPGESMQPTGVVQGQYAIAQKDFRVRTARDNNATFIDTIHCDATSGARLAGLVAAQIQALLLTNSIRRRA